MKKLLTIALLVIFTAGPVLAGGLYRSNPDTCDKDGCKNCKVGDGVVWLVKLPFRLVASTAYGLYDVVVDQDLDGFEKGYDLI